MASTLSVLCNFELSDGQGLTTSGKQGLAADASSEPLEFSLSGSPFTNSPAIAGTAHGGPGTLATATARTVYDDDDDFPIDWDFLFFWADQDCYIQLIASATQVSIQVRAGLPFILGYDSILAAANTTALSGTEPVVTDIDSVVIQNNSGSTMNYRFYVID